MTKWNALLLQTSGWPDWHKWFLKIAGRCPDVQNVEHLFDWKTYGKKPGQTLVQI